MLLQHGQLRCMPFTVGAAVDGSACWAEPSQLQANRTSVRYARRVDDLPRASGDLRRSIAMLPPLAPSALSRERAMAILAQLIRALRELRRR